MIGTLHLRKVKGGYEFGGNIAGVFGKTPEEAESNFLKVFYPGIYEWIDNKFTKGNEDEPSTTV